MRSERFFTRVDANQIRDLLVKKIGKDKSIQKKRRDKIRSLGFYISDFARKRDGFTREDFDALVKNGVISIQ